MCKNVCPNGNRWQQPVFAFPRSIFLEIKIKFHLSKKGHVGPQSPGLRFHIFSYLYKRLNSCSPGLKSMFLLNMPFSDKWNFISISENIDLRKPKTGCCHLLPFGQTFLHYCVIFAKISCQNQKINGEKCSKCSDLGLKSKDIFPLISKYTPKR